MNAMQKSSNIGSVKLALQMGLLLLLTLKSKLSRYVFVYKTVSKSSDHVHQSYTIYSVIKIHKILVTMSPYEHVAPDFYVTKLMRLILLT